MAKDAHHHCRPHLQCNRDRHADRLIAGRARKATSTPLIYTEGGFLSTALTYYGQSCAIPGYRSLGAGTVIIQGPGLAATTALPVPLQGGTILAVLLPPGIGFDPVPAFTSGQVGGLTVYQTTLPSGAIQPGSYKVSASGGSDVGAFQSTVQIGSPIHIQTALANLLLIAGQPLTINWTGGDPTAWVTVKLVSHYGGFDDYFSVWVARASDQTITISSQLPGGIWGGSQPLEMVIEVVPDPSQVPAFSAPGLTLGGLHQWKYTYRFEGLTSKD